MYNIVRTGGEQRETPACLPRVVDVMAESRHKEGELVQRPEQGVDLRGLDDHECHVGDAHGMYQVVEGMWPVPLRDPANETLHLLVRNL